MAENVIPRTVQIASGGVETVVVDGHDISRYVTRAEVVMTPGCPPCVRLWLFPSDGFTVELHDAHVETHNAMTLMKLRSALTVACDIIEQRAIEVHGTERDLVLVDQWQKLIADWRQL